MKFFDTSNNELTIESTSDFAAPSVKKSQRELMFDQFLKQTKEEDIQSSNCDIYDEELKYYLRLDRASIHAKNMDVLTWWKEHGEQYPRLLNLVKFALCVVPTSVPSEFAFSAASEHITKRRNRLSCLSNQAAMCLKFFVKLHKSNKK
ncbi:hypothetical protein O9G_003871 [Rozella allomycis CSF55]|uniref:HAT C-terminal dimerisation domain-containing protein n=1 Tax=Rozella allomycis (strain CSF55) TaxID=988480 RepID=A0A075B478_ROZAC|nr:hypothetical protein O9G_003871 [Rozella allomycis CSF55]|eukprot:EPZ35956.1 hypothetical protein O9G_003871 [Rozella allomycis CSF55]